MRNHEEHDGIMTDAVRHTPDKYDKAIAYLTRHPEHIHDAWGNPRSYEGRGGELFGFVGPDWGCSSNSYEVRGEVSGTCGCLQQIRQAYKNEDVQYMNELDSTDMALSFWPRQWARIAMDRRLPAESEDIGVEDLHVFAEWQRKIDDLRRADGMEVPY